MRLVLFALFDRALVPVEIFHHGKALHGLRRQIAIGHGMADHHRLPSQLMKPVGHQSRDRTLAASGAHRANGNHRQVRRNLRVLGAEQPEIGAGGSRARSQVHQVLVRDVAVGEDHDVDPVVRDQLLHVLLFEDGNAFGIEASREHGG